MTIFLPESFEQPAALADRGWTVNGYVSGIGSYVVAYDTTLHRTGSRCLKIAWVGSSGAYAYASRSLPSSMATVRAAFGIQFTAYTGPILPIITYRDGTTDQISLRWDAGSGTLSFLRGNFSSGTVLGTSVATIAAGGWHHLEIVSTIDPSAGTATVYLDGVSVLTITGVNTRASANASVNNLYLGSMTAIVSYTNSGVYYDDLVLADASGGQGQIGAVSVQALIPTGAGAHTDWTASAGANYACVVSPANGDTDYVSTGTANAIDTYAMSDLAVSGTVLAVAVSIDARDDGGGAGPITPVLRIAGADYLGTSTAIGSSYGVVSSVWSANPAGGGWDVAAVNALEAGVKKA